MDAVLRRFVRNSEPYDDALRRFVRNSEIYKGEVRFPTIQPAAQTRLESALEAAINVATGFAVSWAMWMFVAAPLFDIPAPAGQAFALTCLFTITSMLRSYAWRRFFANDIHKRIHTWLR